MLYLSIDDRSVKSHIESNDDYGIRLWRRIIDRQFNITEMFGRTRSSRPLISRVNPAQTPCCISVFPQLFSKRAKIFARLNPSWKQGIYVRGSRIREKSIEAAWKRDKRVWTPLFNAWHIKRKRKYARERVSCGVGWLFALPSPSSEC